MEYQLQENSLALMRRLLDGTFEIRILENGQYKTVWSCLRDDLVKDWDQTRRRLLELNKTSNVFFTMNPLLPACKSKLAYGTDFIRVKGGEGISDNEIAKYRWLLIDLDPDRPKDVSSTDEEKALAYTKAIEIRQFLSEKRLLPPVFCDSGNGFHLLYRVSLENSKENANLLRDILLSLSEKFSDDHVKVDRKVFNAARIIKFYGTMSRKGRDDKENGRPHRKSGFIEFPDLAEIKVNDRELLVSLVGPKPEREKTSFGAGQAESIDSVRSFMDRHDIPFREEDRHGVHYFYLENGCSFDERHKGKDACVIVGVEGNKAYKCFHDSCEGKHWRDFVRLYEPEYKTYEERRAEEADLMREMFGEEVEDTKGEVKELSYQEKLALFDKKIATLTSEIRVIEKTQAERKLNNAPVSPEEVSAENARLKLLKIQRQEAKDTLKQLKDFGSPKAFSFQLDLDDKGKIKPTLYNFVQILTHDDKMKATYSYNLLSERAHNLLEDKGMDAAESSTTKMYIESKYGIFDRWKFNEAMLQMPLIRSFNPVTDLLDTLKWDGAPRLATALSDYLGAKDTEYTRFVSQMLFISAVARAYEPGCKYDNMVVLVGPQGCGKSLFCKRMALNPRFFTDSIRNIGDDNAIRLMQGYWIIEWGELSALNRAKDAEIIKLFLSQEADVLVPKYANERMEYQRKCVFVGTTNELDGFLTDTTGNRRFFPVEVNEGPKSLVADTWKHEFEQIYAEAVLEYRKGFSFIPRSEILKETDVSRDQHKKYDPRVGEVEFWVQSQPELEYVCAAEIWYELFDGHKPMDAREARAFNAMLRQVPNLKYRGSATKRFTKYGTQRYYSVLNPDSFNV